MCPLTLRGRDHRRLLNLYSMEISLKVIHTLLGFVEGRAELTLLKANTANALKVALLSCLSEEPCTSSDWDLRPEGVKLLGSASSRGAQESASTQTEGTISGADERLALSWTS